MYRTKRRTDVYALAGLETGAIGVHAVDMALSVKRDIAVKWQRRVVIQNGLIGHRHSRRRAQQLLDLGCGVAQLDAVNTLAGYDTGASSLDGNGGDAGHSLCGSHDRSTRKQAKHGHQAK